ncbi:hypothetical protein P154DRAFT_621063 [Amniculicola lignicola CBS 123094]|uniref:Uncharacterized protein n=1 Tax=Amniculicola lignicola CBS 123094 TaxID=1392246 RepID=A0A6A5WCM2_9PLEO|nr:hypothetical protein P154DRAFT_621063 [Amniculicola lignicola CBS 123094]
MRFSTTLLAISAAFSMTAVANNCFKDWFYCGHDLMKTGEYEQLITDTLKTQAKIEFPTEEMKKHTLFFCNDDGGITYKKICPSGCAFGGAQTNDFCIGAVQ